MLAASKCPTAAKHIETCGSVVGGIFLVMSANAPHPSHHEEWNESILLRPGLKLQMHLQLL